jgi:hypothetical protein
LNDPVEPGDVIRTKARSKAQVTFIDDSTLNLSQEARFAIEQFKFEPGQGKRRAVLKIFQGLSLAVVNKILQAEEPDFVIKTQTAIVGVRGTEIGIRNEPNSTTILNFKGRTQVGNILPQVNRLFRKASKVAFDWMPAGDVLTTVLLTEMQATTVGQGQPPAAPFPITPQDKQQFLSQMLGFAAIRDHGLTLEEKGGLGSKHQVPLNPPGSQNTVNNLTTITIPPTLMRAILAPPPPTPSPPQYSPGY